jgi:hypothetical protein
LSESGHSTGHRSPSGAGGRWPDDTGSSVVEAVLVIPVVMLLLLVAVQFALWMHAAQVVQLAASEGDRTARSIGGGPAAGVAAAQRVATGPGSDVRTLSISTDVLPGDSRVVRVAGTAVSVLPGLSFPVSASAVGPIQQFRSSE